MSVSERVNDPGVFVVSHSYKRLRFLVEVIDDWESSRLIEHLLNLSFSKCTCAVMINFS